MNRVKRLHNIQFDLNAMYVKEDLEGCSEFETDEVLSAGGTNITFIQPKVNYDITLSSIDYSLITNVQQEEIMRLWRQFEDTYELEFVDGRVIIVKFKPNNPPTFEKMSVDDCLLKCEISLMFVKYA